MPIYLGKDKISGGGGVSIEEITPEAIGALPETTTPADIGALPTSEKGAENGIASLDGDGKVTAEQASSQIVEITASQALDSSYMGKLIKIHSTNDVTVTMPSISSVPLGGEIEICRYNTGAAIIAPASDNYFARSDTGAFSSASISIPTRFGIVVLKRASVDSWLTAGVYE